MPFFACSALFRAPEVRYRRTGHACSCADLGLSSSFLDIRGSNKKRAAAILLRVLGRALHAIFRPPNLRAAIAAKQ